MDINDIKPVTPGDKFRHDAFNAMLDGIKKNAQDIEGAVSGYRGDVVPSFNFTNAPSGIYTPMISGTYNGDVIVDLDTYPLIELIWNGVTLSKRGEKEFNIPPAENKIETYEGVGSCIDKNTIKITKTDGSAEELKAKNVIIATGSKPTALPFLPIDKKRIITSTEALNLQEVPKHLIVIGGGVIGLELGSVYARLGAKVSVVEFEKSIIGTMDSGLGKELQRVLKKNLGMEFFLGHKVTGATAKGKKVTVTAENPKGETISLEGDYCIVSVGRTAYTEGLGLENIGIKTEERGNKIPVNEHLETSVEGVYAIGDVVKGAMLAHKAEDEGVYVAERIVGQKPHIDYNLIPGVVYTWPEVASVGKTEEQLKKAGTKYKTGSFSFKASGRAKASGDTDGFIKVLADAETDEVLGVHMIGPRAADMIAEAVVAMEYRASAEDIGRICHAHPTFTEAIKEAALAATANRAIHA